MTRLTSVYEEIPTRIREKYPDIASQAFYQTTAILDQKEIMLSNIAINSSIHVLIHTSPVHIANILTHVEKLYELAHSSTDKEAIVRLSGEIFWWICQAKPWYLGDPSIAEMLIRSLWEEKGIENVAWNPSIIPWVETIVEIDVKKFGEKFPSLFIRPII
jgi:hypothetical protein